MRIDAHFHLIEQLKPFCGKGEGRSLGDGRVEFPNGEIIRFIPEMYRSDCFTAEMALELMDQHGIDLAVLLQGGYYGFQNGYTMEMARKYPGRFYPVGTLDPYCIQSEQILDQLIGTWGFRALKFEISEKAGVCGYHPDFRIDGPQMQVVFERANEVGMAIAFDVGGASQRSYQMQGFERMIKRYPNVRFVMCHLLCPNSPDQAGWEQDMRLLMADNVWFEIASLPNFIGENRPYAASVSYIERALRIVGAQRVIWGTDAPAILNRHSYEDLLGYFQNALPPQTIDDVMGKNALTAYAIPVKS